MQTNQRETGQTMIERDLLFPAGFIMALRAVLTLLSLVYIICLVAGKAVRGGLLLVGVSGMAVVTARLLVISQEREPRIAIVVEPYSGPPRFGVTGIALGAKTIVVNVIFLMTTVAVLRRRDLVGVFLMARQAGYTAMTLPQRELGIPVMSEHRAIPAFGAMTFFAAIAQRSAVHVF